MGGMVYEREKMEREYTTLAATVEPLGEQCDTIQCDVRESPGSARLYSTRRNAMMSAQRTRTWKAAASKTRLSPSPRWLLRSSRQHCGTHEATTPFSAQHAATSRVPLVVYKCKKSHCKSLITDRLHSHHPSTKDLNPHNRQPPATMSSNGLLFVTAPQADHKAVNLLLHHLRDWEYDKGRLSFHLVTTKNAFDLEVPPGSNDLDATPPTLNATFDNGWAGATLKDVEGFCLDMIHSGEQDNISPGLFVVVDAAGFEKREGILCERDVKEPEDDEGEFEELDAFVKMRLPWEELYISWCSLSIANVSFDEMGERREDAREEEGEVVDGTGAEGWFDYNSDGLDGLGEKEAKRKEKALRKLEKDGLV
jgi:hypothetical protein